MVRVFLFSVVLRSDPFSRLLCHIPVMFYLVYGGVSSPVFILLVLVGRSRVGSPDWLFDTCGFWLVGGWFRNVILGFTLVVFAWCLVFVGSLCSGSLVVWLVALCCNVG